MGGVLTVAAGVFDMRRASLNEEVHRRVHQHMKVGFTLLAVIAGLTAWRWTVFTQTGISVSAVYLDCAVLSMALAGFQGWLGGELVYTHGVFVKDAGPSAGAKRKAESKHDKSNHRH